MASPVIETVIGSETHTVQLISKEANGSLRIRYKGTAFPVSVLTSKAEKYMALMPEKPKVRCLVWSLGSKIE